MVYILTMTLAQQKDLYHVIMQETKIAASWAGDKL